MSDVDRVEIHTTDSGALHAGAYVTLRVGCEVATLTAGEWAKLVAKPKHGPVLLEVKRGPAEHVPIR